MMPSGGGGRMGVEHRSMVQSAQVQGIVKDAPGEEWERNQSGE